MTSRQTESGISSPRRAGALGWLATLFAALAYLAASGLLTWPVVVRLDSVLFGDFGDTRGWGWWIWAKSNGLLDAPLTPLLAAPFGIPSAQVFNQPLSEGLVLVIARFSNEIAAMNLFVFLSFPLTAIATYFLLDRLLHDSTASFIGGLIFGFSPAAVMQAAGGHAAYAFNAFIPLFLLALFHNKSKRTILSAFYVAASFAGITFTALYFGYFAIYIALYFVVFDYLSGGRAGIVRNYLHCAAFSALIIVPVEFMALFEQFTASREAIAQAGRIRDFNELAAYSSSLWNYLVPSIDHPVLGDYFVDFVRNHLRGNNVFEQTLYLGVVPLGLLLAGSVIAVRGRFDSGHRRYFLFFAWGALWMYFLSLPPKIGGNVPTVSYFAHEIAPMFRVYGRFGILVNFFVACAAAVVLAHLDLRMKHRRYQAIFAAVACVIVFEYWSVPPDHALPVDRPPEVYRWLAEEPGDIIVAEYPMVRFDEAASYTYPFWQRVHGKRLVNGASPDNARAWAFFERVNDLTDPETPALLKSAGVKYVIVHKRMYQEGPIPSSIKRYYSPDRAALTFNGGLVPAIPSSLQLHKVFGGDWVFRLDERRP